MASLDPNRPNKKKQSVAGQDNYMITPCNFSIFDIMTWVLDTGSPINICNRCKDFRSVKDFEMMRDS